MTTVQEIMGRPVVSCHEGDSLERAAGLMWDHDCGVVPVVDDDDRVTGVVTDRDITMAAYTRGQALRDLRVDDAMAKRVFSCAPDDDVDEAETKMAEAQIRRLPVVDGAGHPVGMLSLSDVARATASEGGLSKHRRAFAEILAAICRPGRRAVEAV